MRALHATVVVALLACRPSASRAPVGDAMVTVYVTAGMADRVMGPLQAVAARHRWALSLRTDSGALTDADLTIADSAGRPVARVRRGSAVEMQARELAKGVLP
jgi:predicted oxidoreductase